MFSLPPELTDEEKSRRKALCLVCPYNTETGKCRLCGCSHTLDERTTSRVFHCGRWQDPPHNHLGFL